MCNSYTAECICWNAYTPHTWKEISHNIVSIYHVHVEVAELVKQDISRETGQVVSSAQGTGAEQHY